MDRYLDINDADVSDFQWISYTVSFNLYGRWEVWYLDFLKAGYKSVDIKILIYTNIIYRENVCDPRTVGVLNK